MSAIGKKYQQIHRVCLLLVAIEYGALTQQHDGLYSDYHGEYAAAYDNYVEKPYAFEYGVSDPHTGDHKSQWEMKDEEGVVRGSYNLLESDGSTRSVDYIADKSGFRAIVSKIGSNGHVFSIENHGVGLSHPLFQKSLHEREDFKQIIINNNLSDQKSSIDNIPFYKTYNGEIENYLGEYYPDNSVQIVPYESGRNLENNPVPAQSSIYRIGNSEDELKPHSEAESPFYDQHQYFVIPPNNVKIIQQPASSDSQLYEQVLDHTNDGYVENPIENESTSIAEDYSSYRNIHQLAEKPRFPEQYIGKRQSTDHSHSEIHSSPYKSNVHHPHGESSQSFHSRTGNSDDDSQYTD